MILVIISLIDLLHMGSTRAAIATILAQAVSVLFCLLMMKKKLPFFPSRANMRYDRKLAQGDTPWTARTLLRMCTEISYLVILGFVNVFHRRLLLLELALQKSL